MSTRDYHTFCDAEFGRYLHHDFQPGTTGEGETSAATWRDVFSGDGLDPDALLALSEGAGYDAEAFAKAQCSAGQPVPPEPGIANASFFAQCSSEDDAPPEKVKDLT